MTAPSIVVIDRSEILDGKLAEVETGFRELARFVDAQEPRVMAYFVSFSDDRRIVTVLQVHPDSESMEFHMQVAGSRFAPFAGMLRMRSIDVYGAPGETLLGMLRRKAEMLGAGPPVVHRIEAGFVRFDGD